jgi:hypothetical protein
MFLTEHGYLLLYPGYTYIIAICAGYFLLLSRYIEPVDCGWILAPLSLDVHWRCAWIIALLFLDIFASCVDTCSLILGYNCKQ